jgi:hypothetical protein
MNLLLHHIKILIFFCYILLALHKIALMEIKSIQYLYDTFDKLNENATNLHQ